MFQLMLLLLHHNMQVNLVYKRNVLPELKGLIDKFSYTQERLSHVVGKSRSYIANTLRLLTLPDEIKSYIISGKLKMQA